MNANQTTPEFSEGQIVRFHSQGRWMIGEIIRTTPSTQSIWLNGKTYEIHRTKLWPYEPAGK